MALTVLLAVLNYLKGAQGLSVDVQSKNIPFQTLWSRSEDASSEQLAVQTSLAIDP